MSSHGAFVQARIQKGQPPQPWVCSSSPPTPCGLVREAQPRQWGGGVPELCSTLSSASLFHPCTPTPRFKLVIQEWAWDQPAVPRPAEGANIQVPGFASISQQISVQNLQDSSPKEFTAPDFLNCQVLHQICTQLAISLLRKQHPLPSLLIISQFAFDLMTGAVLTVGWGWVIYSQHFWKEVQPSHCPLL